MFRHFWNAMPLALEAGLRDKRRGWGDAMEKEGEDAAADFQAYGRWVPLARQMGRVRPRVLTRRVMTDLHCMTR